MGTKRGRPMNDWKVLASAACSTPAKRRCPGPPHFHTMGSIHRFINELRRLMCPAVRAIFGLPAGAVTEPVHPPNSLVRREAQKYGSSGQTPANRALCQILAQSRIFNKLGVSSRVELVLYVASQL